MDLTELRRRCDQLCEFMEANPHAEPEEIRNARSRHFPLKADFEAALNDLTDQLQELCGCADNDIEGAALAICALNVTHPDHDDNEYQEEANHKMAEHCSLLRLYFDPAADFPDELEIRVEEMLNMIFDGAERMEGEFQTFN